MNLLQETKLFQIGTSVQKRDISQYAQWVRRQNQRLVGLDVARDGSGAVVAMKQTYRNPSGINSMIFFPDRKVFDLAPEKLTTAPSPLTVDNVFVQIADYRVQIVAIERGDEVELLSRVPISPCVKKLRTSRSVLFLYPAFGPEGLVNLSALRDSQDEWVSLPIYERSLLTKEERVIREPPRLELLPQYANELRFDFKLDLATNTTKVVGGSGDCVVKAITNGVGIFGRALDQNKDNSLKDVKLYAYAPIDIQTVDETA